MKIKDIATRFLSTKLRTLPHTRVVKTYCKTTIRYQPQHKNGNLHTNITKFEYKSISHFRLLGQDYYLPFISPLYFLTL
jgi:hypothetical protein